MFRISKYNKRLVFFWCFLFCFLETYLKMRNKNLCCALWILFCKQSLRSSLLEVVCKNGVLKHLAKFTVKDLCQSLFFNKVAGLRPATFLKKKLWHSYYPVNFSKILKPPFFTEHLRWLLRKFSMQNKRNLENELSTSDAS